MSPPQQLRQRTSNCSSLLIYRPRKAERLSWPSWLTYSGWFTHISGHPSATGRAQDSESTPVIKDRCSTAGPSNQPAGQRKGSGCVKSQAYQGAGTKYEHSGSVLQAGHAESASEPGCWLKTVRSEELGRTYHRRTPGKTKTAGKAKGNHTGNYVRLSMQPHHSELRCIHATTAPHLQYHP